MLRIITTRRETHYAPSRSTFDVERSRVVFQLWVVHCNLAAEFGISFWQLEILPEHKQSVLLAYSDSLNCHK